MYLFNIIFGLIKLLLLKNKWRKINSHNFTSITRLCDIKKVSVGRYTYGPLTVHSWNSAKEFLSIGSFCSIAPGAKFILGGEHGYNLFSTYPLSYRFEHALPTPISSGAIIIEDDVWIGIDAMILSGVKIGRGAIIGAGSVVAKDVAPYSIVVGNPIHLLKNRFSKEIVDVLLRIDFDKIDKELYLEYRNFFLEPIDFLMAQSLLDITNDK